MQNHSKKIHICRYGNVIQYSWNFVLFSLLLFKQRLFKQYSNNIKNHRISVSVELFRFFGNLKDESFASKVLPTIIYNSHLWLFISILNKHEYLQAPNKQRGRLLIFRFFPTRWSLLRFLLGNQRFLVRVYTSPLLLLIYQVCKVWNHFSFFWT